MALRFLFHLHTRRSFDSLLSPSRILSKARQLSVDVLAVTDHNTIRGSLDVRDLARGNSPLVIIAAEYQSEKGDIIGLFLRDEIQSRSSTEIIQQIHEQGGLTVLPHPFKAHKLDDELMAEIDLVEIYNGRCSDSDNERALQLARQWNRPTLAGADGHCALEMDSALNEFDMEAPEGEAEFRGQLLSAPRRVITRKSPRVCAPYSQMVKAIKTKNPRLFLHQAKRMALVLARGDNL